jgi:superfamily II DNA or RNA helicase
MGLIGIQPGGRIFDKKRGKERLVQNVEAQGSIVYLTLRDPVTGQVERAPYVSATLNDRFDILGTESSAFRGNPSLVRLVAEAHRLNHAYLFNPIFATETSLIDPLPHQLVAVYGLPPDKEHPRGVSGLLSHPRLRFLLADDAGAGKTIQAGLYIREMLLRRLVKRILIIPPAGLVGNWERELWNLFRLPFRILDSDNVRAGDNPFTDPRYDHVIVSLDTVRQEKVRAALNDAPPFDLVVCDEAHKLSARRNPDMSVDKSKRYETVEEIAVRCLHLLLLTATPHMGKDDAYFYLWRLLDPQQFGAYSTLAHTRPEIKRRHLLRRMKEEMVTFSGENLYPPRISQTVRYPLTDGERELYEMVTAYVEDYYKKTTPGNRSSVGLALTVIQRRLASSTWSLLQSLERRAIKLADNLKRLEQGVLTEDQFDAQQNRFATKDIREEKTGDEEVSAEDGTEESELFDAEISGATTARSIEELREELMVVESLVHIARATYNKKDESKFSKLQELIEQHPDTKLLIFTEHRDTLNFLISRLEGMGYTGRIATVHGGMDYREREVQTERFRSDECPLMIATDAAGEGINLQFCWLLVNYDIPWNPARLEQRMGRVHRYKQRHDVLLLSLVAEKTREGAVLQTLLDKLDIIRQRLGSDKVFDVIGEQLGGISLADLLFRATVGGEEKQVTDVVNKAFDPIEIARKLDEQKQRVEVSEVRSLLESLKRGQEVAEEKRMMPAYVRTFFQDVAPLLGLRVKGDPNSIFSIEDGPEEVRRALVTYPSGLIKRLTFDRNLALPQTALRPEAVYLHPGEAVFEALMTLFLGRFENDAARGAVFYDPNSTEPYLFALAKIAVVRPIMDAQSNITDGRETLGEEMTGVIIRHDGTVLPAAPAHLLLTLDVGEEGAASSAELPEGLVEIGSDLLPVETSVLEHKGVPLMERLVDDLKSRLPERRNQLIQSYNLRQSEALSQRRRLKDDVAKGVPAAKSKLDKLDTEIATLDDARESALAALHLEIDLIELAPVTVYARALVLPLPPEEAKRRRDVQAESVALKVVYEYETALGAVIEDVSDPHLAVGYDLRSHRPDGSVLYIEVKGRSGLTQIELTANEWRQAANHRDKYWLYTVYYCDTDAPHLYKIADPFGNLLAKDGGIVVDAGDVLSVATQSP